MGKLRKKGTTELRAAGAANFLAEEGDDKKHTQFENWRMVMFFQVYNGIFFVLGSTLAGMGIKLSSDASSSGSASIFETAYVMVISAGIGMVLHSVLGLVSVYVKSVSMMKVYFVILFALLTFMIVTAGFGVIMREQVSIATS